MQTHKLKTWEAYFEAIWDDTKRFELRKNDRDFEEGDLLVLQEYNSVAYSYTGREVLARVTCMVDGVEEWGLMDGHCIMSICVLEKRTVA